MDQQGKRVRFIVHTSCCLLPWPGGIQAHCNWYPSEPNTTHTSQCFRTIVHKSTLTAEKFCSNPVEGSTVLRQHKQLNDSSKCILCEKCENILDCELATLSETRQCKKLISWSGDDGMDLVVSWGLTDCELTLNTLWTKFEDFCKPQSNEVRA